MKAGSYRLLIPSIMNPSYGGTGNFILESRRNSAYSIDINLVDFNYAFGQVGIITAPADFTAVTIAQTSGSVNGLNNLTIQFTTTKILPAGGKIVLDFSSSIIRQSTTFSVTSSLSGNITTTASLITLSNFSADIPVQSITVTVFNVTNPSYVYSGAANSITIRTWLNLTNSVINQRSGVLLPSTVSGILPVTVTSHYALGQAEVISINDITQYQVQFTLQNYIAVSGKIIIQWLSGGLSSGCIVYSGLYDVSATTPVTCTQSGTSFTITGFQRVQANILITVQFTATNPSTGPMGNLQITSQQYVSGSYYNIDTFTGATGLTLQSYPLITSAVLSSSNSVAGAIGILTLTFYNSVALTSGQKIIFKLPTQFTIGASVCVAKNNVPATDTGSCTVSGQTIQYTVGSVAFSTTLANTLTITAITNPTTPGSYPISVNLGSTIARTTIYFVVSPYVLTPTVFQLTSDQSQQTLFTFTFTALSDIPSSTFTQDYSLQTSQMYFYWDTGTTALPQFPLDLGTGVANGGVIPCYGYQSLQAATGSEIQCNIVVPASAPTMVLVIVTNYVKILSGSVVSIHFPKITNPQCLGTGILVTVSVVCPTSAKLKVQIMVTQNRLQYTNYASAMISLPPVVPIVVVKNPTNDNLTGGLPSTPSPVFSPSTINSASTISIRYQPGSSKTLITGQSMIIMFPQLQPTTPMAYILNKQVTCSIGSSNPQTCYSYREVGWVVILSLTQALPVAPALDVTFILSGLTNPFYAAIPSGNIEINTVLNTAGIGSKYERLIYKNLPAYSAGGTGSVQVAGRNYQANQINVQYNWLISFNDNIPAGGSIQLIYPVNYFNVEDSSPAPKFVIKQGLTTTTGFTSVSHTNIFTISGFQPYTKGTLISVEMTGVRNPPNPGRTNYFGVQSLTGEGFTIDSNAYISTSTIITQQPQGTIIFNAFTMVPDNGAPTGGVFPASYLISFYITRTIPAGGKIQITFPSQFTAASFLNSPLRCYVAGALSTFKSCTIALTVITITLDADLRIESGMAPVNVTVPQVNNFQADISSGVVVVQTMYDSVILDASGTTDTNRKATTGFKAVYIPAANTSLSYYPITEGELGSYNITIQPSLNISSSATIIVQFPISFPYDLGGAVGCDIPLLSKASNDPIQCSVKAQQVTLSNFAAYVVKNGFNIIVTGVTNPNQGTYTTGISVYIMSNSTHAQEFVQTLGSMTFSAGGAILQMPSLLFGTSHTREYADVSMALIPDNGGTFTQIQVNFMSGFQIAALWSANSVTDSFLSETVPVTPTLNSFKITNNYSVTAGTSYTITVSQLPTPLDPGIQPGYPSVALYDAVSKKVLMKSYWNLMQPLTPNFNNAGQLIVIGSDDPNYYIEAGTYLNEIVLSVASAAVQDIAITPVFDSSFSSILTFTPMSIGSSTTTGTFRIGVDSSITVLKVVIKFTHNAPAYIAIRPIYLWIQRNLGMPLSVSQIVSVPAGGRSGPQYVFATYGPYQTLLFTLSLLNNVPASGSIFPSTISLTAGQRNATFWVSCGPMTQGTSSSVLLQFSGNDKATFKMTNRLSNFTVSQPDNSAPFVVASSFISSSNLIVNIQTSMACTFYYSVGPTFMRNVSFWDIKNKTVPYDYFNYKFFMGEYIAESSSYQYQFSIDGLQNASLYQLTLYIQGLNGNLAAAPIYRTFNTTGYTSLLSDSVSVTSAALLTQTNNSLVIGNITATGTVYGIALPNPYYALINHYTSITTAIRQLATTNTTTNTTTNSTNKTASYPVLQGTNYVPNSSLYTCTQGSLNYLCVICSPIVNLTVNGSRVDYYVQEALIAPTGYQVSRGENYQGLLVLNTAVAINGELTFQNLTANTDYYVYLASASGGLYSNTSYLVRGTTRQLITACSYILAVMIYYF